MQTGESLHILHFYGHHGANGVTAYIADISRRLRERGYQVGAVCRTDSALCSEPGSHTYRYLWGAHHGGLRRQLRALLADVDLLLVHSQRDASVALAVARDAGVPTAYVVHELSRLAGDLAPAADSVIAVSAGVGAFLCDTYALPAERLYIIPNGIDFASLPAVSREDARREFGFALDEVWLAFVGRITSNKNLHGLVQALGQVKDQAPHLRLAVAGSGKRAGRARRLAKQQQLGDRVRFLGWRPREETLRLVTGADLFVLPSLGAEGLSIALLQAMAQATPPLASDIPSLVGGPVRHGETGWLCDCGDPAAFAQALLDIAATSPEVRAALGRAARDEVYHHHRIELVVDGVEAVIRETVGREGQKTEGLKTTY